MKSLRIFAFFLLLAFSFGSFQLSAAPKTLDEIAAEQKKKEKEEKNAPKEVKKKAAETQQNEEAAKQAEEEQSKAEEAGQNAETGETAAETPEPAEQSAAPAENPEQASVQIAKTYTITEHVIGIPKPLAMMQIDNAALMNTDPKAVELFEQASKKEKEEDILKNPGEVMKLWRQLAGIAANNPFAETARTRFEEWNYIVAFLNKHQENLDKISKLIPANIIPAEQKVSLVSQHLDEFGVAFGTDEILNITKNTQTAEEIAKNETFRNKIKEIQIARCNQNSGKDCFSTAKYFAANDEEKITFFGKACGLKYQAGCDEVSKVKNASEAEKARRAEEEKAQKEQQLKNELNKAGRKTRLIIATSTLAAGVVLGALGGVSFYVMDQAEKDRKTYYNWYLADQEYPEYYWDKASKCDKKRKTYLALGIAGASAGVALIATGITFYSIEFKGEKEVKKKYNVSFGASPADGTLQFALKW